MLICPKCGEKEKFTQVVYYREQVAETQLLDANFEFLDNLDSETIDSERTDEDKIECYECDAETEEISNEKDYHTFIWEHTDKNGDWDKDGVDEDQRDPDYWNSVISKKV